MKIFVDMILIQLFFRLFLLLNLLALCLTSRPKRENNEKICTLCKTNGHIFRAHVIQGDLDQLRNVIENYFANSQQKGGTQRFFNMIRHFLAVDVKFLLEQSPVVIKDKSFLADVFRLLLSRYRDIWNPTLRYLDMQIKQTIDTISNIALSDMRDLMSRVLTEEFERFKVRRNFPNEFALIDHVKTLTSKDCSSIDELVNDYFRRHTDKTSARFFLKTVNDYLSVHINSLLDDTNFALIDKKAILIEVFDRLVVSYIEKRNRKQTNLGMFADQLFGSLAKIKDATVRMEIFRVVLFRLDNAAERIYTLPVLNNLRLYSAIVHQIRPRKETCLVCVKSDHQFTKHIHDDHSKRMQFIGFLEKYLFANLSDMHSFFVLDLLKELICSIDSIAASEEDAGEKSASLVLDVVADFVRIRKPNSLKLRNIRSFLLPSLQHVHDEAIVARLTSIFDFWFPSDLDTDNKNTEVDNGSSSNYQFINFIPMNEMVLEPQIPSQNSVKRYTEFRESLPKRQRTIPNHLQKNLHSQSNSVVSNQQSNEEYSSKCLHSRTQLGPLPLPFQQQQLDANSHDYKKESEVPSFLLAKSPQVKMHNDDLISNFQSDITTDNLGKKHSNNQPLNNYSPQQNLDQNSHGIEANEAISDGNITFNNCNKWSTDNFSFETEIGFEYYLQSLPIDEDIKKSFAPQLQPENLNEIESTVFASNYSRNDGLSPSFFSSEPAFDHTLDIPQFVINPSISNQWPPQITDNNNSQKSDYRQSQDPSITHSKLSADEKTNVGSLIVGSQNHQPKRTIRQPPNRRCRKCGKSGHYATTCTLNQKY